MAAEGLGEFGRIARFFAPLAGPGGLGLRDDAALVDCTSGHRLVVTVDALVAGVHFLPDDPPELIARKLLRVNLSDLAAMAARPLYYLLTTALPATLGDIWVERFAAGLREDQRHFEITLLGGDSVATAGPAVLSLTAFGEVAVGGEIRRAGARPGDRIWVSGTIGDAYLGLMLLKGACPQLPARHRAALVARFQVPEPRVALGPRLTGSAHAMCDVSDGLLADLGHICEASLVAATVSLSALPLSAAAQAMLAEQPELAAALASGGDDYELLFAAPPEASAAIKHLASELKLPITAIGTIDDTTAVAAGRVRLVDADGAEIPVRQSGWRHF